MSRQEEKQALEMLRLENLSLAERPKVVAIHASPYVDSLGDDALRVIVFLAPDTPDNWLDARHTGPIQMAIQDALTEADLPYWPYVRFRRADPDDLDLHG